MSHNIAFRKKPVHLMRWNAKKPTKFVGFFAWGNMRVRPETPDASRWAMMPACFPAQIRDGRFYQFLNHVSLCQIDGKWNMCRLAARPQGDAIVASGH